MNIDVFTNIDDIDIPWLDIIVLALPSHIQWTYAIDLLEWGYKNILLIETPVTWKQDELSVLQSYDNVLFFIEEYYTLLARFLRRSDVLKIEKIDVELYVNQQEGDIWKEVSLLHVRNNFIWLKHVPKVSYSYIHHESEKIYYNISFIYQNQQIEYRFWNKKTFRIWDDVYTDVFNFDFALSKVLRQDSELNKDYVIYHKDF